MTLALDGSAHAVNSSTTSLSVSLTTSNANDVIVVLATINQGPITSVTGGGLTWTKRADNGNNPQAIEMWYAIAATALSAVSITVTQSGAGFLSLDAFGVSGADTTSPWDTNAALPATVTSGNPSISTTAVHTFCIGGLRDNPSVSLAGSGWTKISAADFQIAEYQIVSSAQSGLSVTAGEATTINGGIGDAIVASSSATQYTLTGPSSGTVGVASTNFTVTPNGALSGSDSVTLSDGGAGGTFTPSSLSFASGSSAAQTFTYTAASPGTVSISATSSTLGLTVSGSPITYTVGANNNNQPLLLLGVA